MINEPNVSGEPGQAPSSGEGPRVRRPGPIGVQRGPSRAAAERALKAEFTNRQAPADVGAITAATRPVTLAEAWIEGDHG
jgi:hypothetical protein